MADRKVELERKKAKLQAMRDEKRRKEEDRRKREVTSDLSINTIIISKPNYIQCLPHTDILAC